MGDDLDALDSALGCIVGQGWDDGSATTPDVGIPTSDLATPEPSNDAGLQKPEPPQQATPTPEYPPLPVRPADVEPEPPADSERGVMDIGLLADLAAGRKTAEQAAAFAGVSVSDIQSSLATALREVPPEEIAKAMGLQAAEQQLKSGAIYGAVLADLVADMAEGRLKPETKIELAKLLARVGRVEPKEDKGVGAGGGFVLNINLGNAERPVTIDAG